MKMPSAAKSLHLAGSFEELMKRVDADTKSIKDKYFKGAHLRMLCTSARKVLETADLDRSTGDEERSFLLYMRYFSMVEFIRKHKDYPRTKASCDQLMMVDHCARVMDTLEQQKRSLQKRYAILKDAKEAEAQEKRAEEEAKQPQTPLQLELAKPVEDTVVEPAPAAVPVTTQLSAFKLLEMLQDSDTKVLVMDARPRQDFLSSHLRSVDCISVPEEVLKPGIIAEELSRIIPEESVELFEKRHLVDFVVLVDWRSPDVPVNNQAPLRVLKDAIYKWSTQKLLKSEPVVLKDGFEDWLIRFPTHTTNAHARVPESVPPDILVSNYSDTTDGIYFPDPDNLFAEAAQQVKPMPAVDRSKKPSLSNGPVAPRVASGPAESLGGVRSNTEVLQVDPGSKPSPGGPFSEDGDSGEPLEKLLDLTREREEALQAHIRQLEKEVEQRVTDLTRSNQLFQQKLKEKDKELVRIVQLNEEQRRADREVHRLREERKRKEQQEREEAPRDDRAAQVPPPRSLKPAAAAAVNGTAGPTTAPQERPQTASMRSTSGLTRSRSFPNLSMAAEETSAESAAAANSVPQFDRTLKPSQSVETNAAVICRQPRARTGEMFYPRVRSISPSSGQELKRSAGLRNLGNTCYMNATLQCLANTIPLALHFLSDRYKADISRDTHRGGETAHEFKNLLAQMYYNDKSVSPKGFKCLMGRLFSVYAGYEQQDAHEFLLNFMDKLHEDLNRAPHRKGPPVPLPALVDEAASLNVRINHFWCQHVDRHLSVISDLFEGLLVSSLTCLVCRKSSSSFEVFSCLSLPIPANKGSVCYLQDCLKLFLETESMSGEAAWHCPSCRQKRKAEKRMIIARLPKILVIQFNRFRCETAWQSKKLQTYVQFPISGFDINCFVDREQVETQPRPAYRLYAFLNHYGTLATGHYIAYCRAGHGGQWYMYDDASVTEVTLSESDLRFVLPARFSRAVGIHCLRASAQPWCLLAASMLTKRNAYILFYTSVDMRHQFSSHP
ncbi:ubiquitin carboxyl-terminal hydrolase 8-like isoform X5 [Amblyomma americanum]